MFAFPEPMRLCLVGEPAACAEGAFNQGEPHACERGPQLPPATELSSMPAAWAGSVCVCLCLSVSVCVCLCLSVSAAGNPADVVQFCPNKSAAGVICNKPLDPKQHHCNGCRYGGGVDRRHAALARCLADIIHSHSGVKVFVEQEVPALTRVVNGQTEHARMDLVFNLNGSITYLDASIVAPFSCNLSLVSAASTKPGLMAKRAEKTKFDRYPHINLVPFILETTGRPGPTCQEIH